MCACTYVCVYICVHVRMCACTCVCVYVCVNVSHACTCVVATKDREVHMCIDCVVRVCVLCASPVQLNGTLNACYGSYIWGQTWLNL